MYALIVTDGDGNVVGVHSSESIAELKRLYLPPESFVEASYRENVVLVSTHSGDGYPHGVTFTFIEIED